MQIEISPTRRGLMIGAAQACAALALAGTAAVSLWIEEATTPAPSSPAAATPAMASRLAAVFTGRWRGWPLRRCPPAGSTAG